MLVYVGPPSVTLAQHKASIGNRERLCSSQCIPRPTPPRGSLGVATGFTWGFAARSNPWGVGVVSSFVLRLESRDLSILKIILTLQVTAIK